MDENIILESENVKIKNDNNIFKIEFKLSAYSLINSLIKTRIIQGGSTDETYKSIIFKANSVKSLEEYKKDKMISQGKKILSVSDLSKAILSLSMQLNYLIEIECDTILGYNPSDIIVINDEKFAFIGSELVANIDIEDNKMATISWPFCASDFYISPELLKVKEIPSKIHYKTAYFSLGILLIYMLLEDDDFYKEYLNHKHSEKILESLNNNPIKNTRIYWLLSRCLVEEAKNRSIILI
jgi:serine/threonine protein kinase